MAEMTRAEAAALLGVPENADKAAVNAAVRKLTSKYHPDAVRNKSPEEQKEAERIFKSLNKAKKVMFEPPKPEQPAAAPTSTFASSAGMAGGGYAGSSQKAACLLCLLSASDADSRGDAAGVPVCKSIYVAKICSVEHTKHICNFTSIPVG